MNEYKALPGGTPEFRLLQKEDGSLVQQVRYVFGATNYIGKWMDIPIVKENDQNNKPSA